MTEHDPLKFSLTDDEVVALINFLYDVGYISYEFHPMIHTIKKKADNYIRVKKGLRKKGEND